MRTAAVLVALAALVVSGCGAAHAAGVAAEGPAPTGGAGAAAATTGPTDPPRRVLVLGDSTMVDVAPALVAAFAAGGSDVVDAARAGVGLTRFAFDDDPWSPDAEWADLVEAHRPDLTVVMLGAWDMPFVEHEGPWPYVDAVERASTILTAHGGRVLWLSTPTEPGRPDWPMDQVFEVVAAASQGRVTYAEVDAAVRAPDGTYPPSFVLLDGSTVRLRKADGFHFCAEGAERAADEVNRLAAVHGLAGRARPGWEDGAWRDSERYDDPACRP